MLGKERKQGGVSGRGQLLAGGVVSNLVEVSVAFAISQDYNFPELPEEWSSSKICKELTFFINGDFSRRETQVIGRHW